MAFCPGFYGCHLLFAADYASGSDPGWLCNESFTCATHHILARVVGGWVGEEEEVEIVHVHARRIRGSNNKPLNLASQTHSVGILLVPTAPRSSRFKSRPGTLCMSHLFVGDFLLLLSFLPLSLFLHGAKSSLDGSTFLPNQTQPTLHIPPRMLGTECGVDERRQHRFL